MEQPESGYQGEDKPKEELARDATDILMSRAPMLNDYFSMEFDTDANILSIPLLLGEFSYNKFKYLLILTIKEKYKFFRGIPTRFKWIAFIPIAAS